MTDVVGWILSMHRPPESARRTRQTGSPVGEALTWAARIIAIGLAMFLPAVAGAWLDARLDTRFLAAAGLVLGFSTGLAWLVQIGGRKPR